MSETLLSVEDLSVAFTVSGKTTQAVNSISFDISKGETVALVGPTFSMMRQTCRICSLAATMSSSGDAL